jgi:hypothetical protein
MAEIRTVFVATKIGTIAGSYITKVTSPAMHTSVCCATTWSSTRARSSRCVA